MVKAAARNVPDLDVRVAALPDLPFSDGDFDAVTANFVINAVHDSSAALVEMGRVLRLGGKVALTCWSNPRPPVLSVAVEAIAAAGVEWPSDVPVARFGEYSSPGAFAALLDGTGFVDATAQRVSWEYRVNPESWWEEVFRSGVGSSGVVIGRQDAATVARIKAEYDRLVARYAVGDGQVALPAVAILASATR
jgi:SAM-dependent methyltransferase